MLPIGSNIITGLLGWYQVRAAVVVVETAALGTVAEHDDKAQATTNKVRRLNKITFELELLPRSPYRIFRPFLRHFS